MTTKSIKLIAFVAKNCVGSVEVLGFDVLKLALEKDSSVIELMRMCPII